MSDNNVDVGDRRLYKIAQNISWFLFMTLWFNLSFVPLFFFFLFVQPTLANIVWYLIGMIPLGPAIGALVGATIHVIEEDDFSEPGRDFRRYYKKNFMDTVKIWLPFLFLLYLFSVNINYYIGLTGGTLALLGYVFIILTVVLSLYLIPVLLIQVKFAFRFKDLLKLGWYYFFMKMKLTVGNLLIIFIIAFLLLMISEWLLLAMPALLSYIWVLYNYSIIKDVRAHFVKKEE